MTDSAQPKRLLTVAVLFAAAGLVLGEQTWVASPRVHLPSGIAYVVAAALLTTAVMIGFQVFGFSRWNDLLAAVLFLGIAVETSWLAVGSGARPCRVGLWRPPESACRAAWGVGALIWVVMAVWAMRRHLARRRSE
jgi:hypothetical protein